jgi:quercetin dioxygenase-like cupin family protein
MLLLTFVRSLCIFIHQFKTGENPMSQEVFNPATLVEVQPEAIVSRTLIEQKSGTVTVFAFGKGQKLSEHTAPFDALVQVLQGSVRISIDGKPLTLSRGEAIVMPANHPHALEAVEDMKILLAMIRV